MSLGDAKKIINRSNTLSLHERRILRAVADALSDGGDPQTAVNTAAIAANAAATTAVEEEVQLGAPTFLAATVAGTAIAPTDSYVVVSSANAAYYVLLPAATTGKVLRILPKQACKLRSSIAGDKVNNVVVGATYEATLTAGTLYTLVYSEYYENWVMTGLTALGAVEAPVVPDAL